MNGTLISHWMVLSSRKVDGVHLTLSHCMLAGIPRCSGSWAISYSPKASSAWPFLLTCTFYFPSPGYCTATGAWGSPPPWSYTLVLQPGPSLPCTYALSVYPCPRLTERVALRKDVHRVPQITITSKWDIKMYFLHMIASKCFTPA